ncbi:acyltransferase family protein [Bryocella elongata]|uniref:acyltransferase family protein n=1 Tax=Bryocella elongata TaxID=863522 RepID=UPI00135A3BCE|nr:acyltransferase [Bryocella elongata]
MASSPQRAAAVADTAQVWVKPHYASFQGLRGLAVLAVTLHHTPMGPFADVQRGMGWMGVDLFFVLSGFLITGILFDSLERPGYFRNFYVRRSLRIFPIYYLAFALLLVATPLLRLRWSLWSLAYLGYGGNFVVPFLDLVRHNPTQVLMQVRGHWTMVCDLGPLWSLCVEEQFYLVWPAVVWFVRDRRTLMRLCAVIFMVAPVFRTAAYLTAPPREIGGFLLLWSSFTRCDTLLVGAWLALWLRGEKLTRSKLRGLGCGLIAGAGLMLVPSLLQLIQGARMAANDGRIGMAWAHPATNPFTVTVGLSLNALVCAGVLLLALDETTWLSRMLRLRWLAGVGTISYGVYFYAGWLGADGRFLTVLNPKLAGAAPMLHLLLTLVVAALSYRLLEAPILRLKERYAPARRWDVRPEVEQLAVISEAGAAWSPQRGRSVTA